MKNSSIGNFSSVSIIICCRNEKNFIEKCLNSIIEQDYPKEKIEVLIVDGMSKDGTRKILRKYAEQYLFVKFLDNPDKFTPFALNIGIKTARGKIIMWMSAHAVYEKDYISKCVKYLKKHNADNVGGILKTIPEKNTLLAKSIAFCLSSFFGAGGSYFRTGLEKPRIVDTVFGGCYKKDIFKKIGLFNEKMKRSQDYEFNMRLKKAGGKIILVPDIITYYYPKSDLKNFLKHNFIDGIWITYPLKFKIKVFSLRHLIPFFFALSLMILLILSIFSLIFFWLFLFVISLYFLISFYFSVKIASREKDFRYLFLMPVIFIVRHFFYGLGSIWGLFKIIINKKT